jgi:hypothetical protein
MGFTNFPNGITSFGVPIFGGNSKLVSTGPSPRSFGYGNTWFVNAYAGGNGYDGKSPQTPFLTMEKAFEFVQSGDVINFCGKITEQLVTPINIFDVWINGTGNRPRHADATPVGGNFAAAQWAPPSSGGTAAQATIRVLQQGWRFTNILFTSIDANAGCIELVRNAASGDDERDASHAEIIGNRFAGTGIGIKIGATSFTENVFNALIDGNTFNNMSQGIFATSCQPNGIQILNNYFFANTKNITAKLQGSRVQGNIIGPFTAASSSGGIDLTGGVAGNVITLNYLSGTYSNTGGYVAAGAGDEWGANMNVISGGWTAADPA